MARDNSPTAPTVTEVKPSLTGELIFAANLAASDSDRSGVPPGWAAEQRALLPAAVRASIPLLSPFWWPTLGLVDFLCHNGHLHNPLAFLEDLEQRPLPQFLSILLNGDVEPPQVEQWLRDPSGLDAAVEGFSRFSQGPLEAHRRLFADPEGFRQRLVDLLRASDTPLFRETFEQLVRESEGTVRTLQRRLETEAPLALAESLWQKTLMPGTALCRWFAFVPTRLIGHAHIQSWGNQRAIFFLQEGGASLTAPTGTGRDLADFLKVLGDPTRMDILRLLCCQPSYGKEIAERLKLTTATVSRHLDQLKEAGLVREERADANNVKRLRYLPEGLDGQLDKLRAYLLHS